MEEAMRNRTLSSKSRNIACYSHISSFIDAAIPKLTILPPKLKISLTIQFTKKRLHMIKGSEQRITTKMKKKKHRSWVKPINRLASRISSMIYSSLGRKKSSSSHWDDFSDRDDDVVEEEEEERGERENDESLEYLMYKLSLALDGTTSSRYIPLMELLKQMRGGDGGGRLVRERKVGRRFHMFSRRRRRRNRARTIGKIKKVTGNNETVEEREEEEEWANGEELCNRRILMGWRCRPIKDVDHDDHDGVFLSDY